MTPYMQRLHADFAAQGYVLATDDAGYYCICVQSGGCKVPLANAPRFSGPHGAENWLRGFEHARARFEQMERTG